jgi:hypothetical protein
MVALGPHALACALVNDRIWCAKSSIYETARLVVDRVHFAEDHFELRMSACFKPRGHALKSTTSSHRELVCKGQLQAFGEDENLWYVISNIHGRVVLRWRLDTKTGKIRNFTLSGMPLMLFFEPQRDEDDEEDDMDFAPRVANHLGSDERADEDWQKALDSQLL